MYKEIAEIFANSSDLSKMVDKAKLVEKVKNVFTEDAEFAAVITLVSKNGEKIECLVKSYKEEKEVKDFANKMKKESFVVVDISE